MTSDRSTRAILAANGSTRRGDTFDRGGARYREKSLVLEAAITEYLRLQQEGTPVTATEFCERYPDYRHSLKRLIDVEQVFSAFGELPADKWPEVGSRFLDYKIIELLGAGSIARVFLAAELQLGGRPVAIKVSPHGGYEAETLGKLRHPNIVEVYSVHHEPETGLTAVCMPYRGSATLSDLLDEVYKERKPPSSAKVILDVARRMAHADACSEDELRPATPEQVFSAGSFTDAVVRLAIQLASALEYAHDHGVMHRDLKPSNVLLTPSGCPMLLDFNLSYDEALNMVHRGGTLPYSAPEQLLEAKSEGTLSQSAVDDRADIFSLGAILYELLTGQLPYGSPPSNVGPREAIHLQLTAHQTPPPSIRKQNPQVSRELEEVILRCLELSPDQRFRSMFELEMALRRHFRFAASVRRWLRRNRPRVAIGAVAAVGLAIPITFSIASRLPAHERAFALAQKADQSADYELAIAHLSDSLDAKPDYAPALFWRGLMLQKIGDHDGAREAFARTEPYMKTGDLWEHRAYSEFALKNYAAAFQYYLRAGRLSPDSIRLQLSQIYTCFASQDGSKSLGSANLFVQQHPERYEGYLLRALIVYRSTAHRDLPFESAIDDIRKAASITSTLPLEFEAARMLAAAARNQPELLEEAQQHLARAIDHGCARRFIEPAWEFSRWRDEEWFRDSLERAQQQNNQSAPVVESAFVFEPPLLISSRR